MPILRKSRPTKTVELPDSKAKVEVYQQQTYGDYLAIQQAAMGKMKISAEKKRKPLHANKQQGAGKGSNNDQVIEADLTEFMANTLERMIADWDFTDENNKKLPVTKENIGYLSSKDALYLFNQVDTGTLGEDEDPSEDEEERQKKEV